VSTVNRVVREHQVEIDWQHQEAVSHCWGYYDRLRQAFFPDFPDCFLRCERTNARQKFVYHKGDNGVGAQYEFVLNADYLGLPRYYIASLLLHGLIHMWQETLGHRSVANAYHNHEFEERSRQLGVVCKRGRGCDVVAWEPPFRRLVMEADADAYQPLVTGVWLPAGGDSPQKKWSCGCTIIRAATEVSAQCARCGHPFTRRG